MNCVTCGIQLPWSMGRNTCSNCIPYKGAPTCKVCHCTLPYTVGVDVCRNCQPGLYPAPQQGGQYNIYADFAAATPQSLPTGDGEDVTTAVMADLAARSEFGLKKYGTRLKTHNGRDALMDSYQEALDLCCYLKQAIMERE